MNVGTILQDLGIALNDTAFVRWTRTELVSAINEAQRVIATLVPFANAQTSVMQLVAGTKQTIPSNAIQLLDVIRNMGTSGTTPGRAIKLVTRESLDAADQDWHSASPSQVATNYIYNPADPRHFYVYPPQPNTAASVELVCATIPPKVTYDEDVLALHDSFATAVLEYALYRSFSKDAEIAAAREQAALHYTAFKTMVGAGESENIPGLNLAPVNYQGPTG